MNYQNFVNEMKTAVADRIPNAEILLHTVRKNNDRILIGLSVAEDECSAVPTIYLEQFHEAYREGRELDALAEELVEIYREHRITGNVDLDALNTYRSAKRRIYLKAINRKRNRELLKEVPHLSFLDLALIPYLLLNDTIFGNATTLVKRTFLELWEIGEETLLHDASQNMRGRFSYDFTPLSELLKKIAKLPPGDEADRNELYVLRSNGLNWGAALMAVEEIMEEIAQKLTSDFYVLPSSIYELLILPVQDRTREEELTEMVREVNRTSVSEEDYLSDHAYFYQQGHGFVTMNNN